MESIYAFRYLWGKAIEAAFLWAKSPDGKISINFEAGEVAKQTIETNLPEKLEKFVKAKMDEFLPYFKAHQAAMIQHQCYMTPDHIAREIALTLEYLPRIGMEYAISKGFHEMKW
jgi:predicted transcriptional regulator